MSDTIFFIVSVPFDSNSASAAGLVTTPAGSSSAYASAANECHGNAVNEAKELRPAPPPSLRKKSANDDMAEKDLHQARLGK